MVQKKKSKILVPFHGKFLSKLVKKSVCHRSPRKWSECRNATVVSQVTPPVESIEMVQYLTISEKFLNLISLWIFLLSTYLVSPRQTVIYMMCPTDHNIWSLLITMPQNHARKSLCNLLTLKSPFHHLNTQGMVFSDLLSF